MLRSASGRRRHIECAATLERTGSAARYPNTSLGIVSGSGVGLFQDYGVLLLADSEGQVGPADRDRRRDGMPRPGARPGARRGRAGLPVIVAAQHPQAHAAGDSEEA